jgi:hypothetical protein
MGYAIGTNLALVGLPFVCGRRVVGGSWNWGKLKIWLAGETVNKARPFRQPALLFVYPAFPEGKAGFFFFGAERSDRARRAFLEGTAERPPVSIDGHEAPAW